MGAGALAAQHLRIPGVLVTYAAISCHAQVRVGSHERETLVWAIVRECP
jgi:hypothetical protein